MMRLALLPLLVSLAVASDVCLVYKPDMEPTGVPEAVDCYRPRRHKRDAGGKDIQREGSAISWTLVCDASRHPCAKVEHALPLMSRFLENVVHLNAIRIHVKMESFCKGKFFCQISTVGETVTSQYISVTEDGQTFLYPQALFKQRDRGKTPRYEPYDMYIRFNTDRNFYFPADYPNEIGKAQVTFIDTLVHEVNHGLGFMSSLASYLPGLVTPVPQILSSPQSEEEIKFYFSAYDKRIHTKSQATSFANYAAQLDRMARVTVPYPQLTATIKDYPHHAIFQNLTKVVDTDQDLYLNTYVGVNVTLECSRFRKGGTLSHFDSATYDGTRDGLMRASRPFGSGIHLTFDREKPWIRSPYGEATLQVLSTLGYTLNSNPVYEDSLEYYYFTKFTESFWVRAKKFFALVDIFYYDRLNF